MTLAELWLLAVITSFKIVFVWAAMQEGMVLFWLRRVIDIITYLLPAWVYLRIRKPLYDCLTCMAGVWGMIFTAEYFEWSWQYLQLLFLIGGINYLLDCLIKSVFNDESETV